MLGVICVGLGGFIGAILRHALNLIPVSSDFPVMTFLINFIGSVAIGVVFEISTIWSGLSDNSVLFLKTGLCGGFTTFSTFSLETMLLLEQGKYLTGAAYACGSVLVCLGGVVCGRLLAHAIKSMLICGE